MRKSALLICLFFSLTVFANAKDKPKDYPLTCTVVSFHAQAEVRGSGSGYGSNSICQSEGSVGTYERRIYVGQDRHRNSRNNRLGTRLKA